MPSLRTVLAYSALIAPVFSAAVSKRATAGQGWSLQASTCPANTQSCGSGACCPSSSHCQSTGNGEVYACCPTTSNCRGSVEGGPTCADPAWSLWKGNFNNGFCCQVGMTGVYQSGSSTAGTCVSGGVPSGYIAATLQTQGTGTPVGGGGGTTTTTTGPTSTTTAPGGGSNPTTIPRAVFAHYLVGTLDSKDQAVKDVQDAKAVGFDAFALNTHTISSSDTWMVQAVEWLFEAATENNFKLFFSFDMSWKAFQPADIPAFINQYASQSVYYKVNNKPFVSTFWGGALGNDAWNSFRQGMSNQGQTPFFVPDFDDASGYPSNFFSTFPSTDGAFSWEAAWPSPGNAPAHVSDSVDSNAQSQAKAAGKIYMMPVSSFQFKYMGSGNDWFRIGNTNLPERFEQVLSLQPDLVEFLTWNDAGEGHYIGNFYDSQIAGTNIGDYADGFDHTGWQKLVSTFITAYKSGASSLSSTSVVGSLWYRTLLTSASCSSSIQNYQSAQDTVNYAVVLPAAGYKINVYSNGQSIGSFAGNKGLNYGSVAGLAVGSGQKLEIVDSTGKVVNTATGTKAVAAQSSNSVCNWNYEVVGL